MVRERLKNAVTKKYRDDVKRLSQLWPAEQVTLEELYKGKRAVRLHSGETHVFDDEDVSRILGEVPQYIWGLVRVPLLLQYVKYDDGTIRYRVAGDVWQRRLAELLVSGTLSSTGISELNVSSFTKLIARYKTMVFVSISI